MQEEAEDEMKMVGHVNQGMELPELCMGAMCEIELAGRGISVFGAERFFCGNTGKASALRLAACSTKNERQIRFSLYREAIAVSHSHAFS